MEILDFFFGKYHASYFSCICKTKGKKTMNLNLNELLMQLSLPFRHLRSQPYQDLEHQLHYEQQRLTF